MSSEVGKSKLLVGILQSADIASTLTDFLKFSDDTNRLATTTKEVQIECGKALSTAQELAALAQQDGRSIVSKAITEFARRSQVLLTLNQNQLMQSGAGYRMTSAMMASNMKAVAQNGFVDLYGSIAFDMPESYVRDKVTKFYNQLFRHLDLNANTAIQAFNRGRMTRMEMEDNLAKQGISDHNMTIVRDAVENYPDIRTLFRLMSVIDFSDSDVEWVCKMNNITLPQTVQMWKNFIHATRLRDEATAYAQFLKQARIDGLISADVYKVQMAPMKMSSEEVTQQLINVEHEYSRILVRNEMNCLIWLYRKGTLEVEAQEEEPIPLVEDYFYDKLVALGIDSAMCNAVVRLEAAKQGIDWERV